MSLHCTAANNNSYNSKKASSSSFAKTLPLLMPVLLTLLASIVGLLPTSSTPTTTTTALQLLTEVVQQTEAARVVQVVSLGYSCRPWNCGTRIFQQQQQQQPPPRVPRPFSYTGSSATAVTLPQSRAAWHSNWIVRDRLWDWICAITVRACCGVCVCVCDGTGWDRTVRSSGVMLDRE